MAMIVSRLSIPIIFYCKLSINPIIWVWMHQDNIYTTDGNLPARLHLTPAARGFTLRPSKYYGWF